MASFEITVDASEGDVPALGWSDASAPFGTLDASDVTDIEGFAQVTGLYTTVDAEGRLLLNLVLIGPADNPLNYPSSFDLTQIVVSGTGIADPVTLVGAESSIVYHPTGNLGSDDAADAAFVYQWPIQGVFEFEEYEAYTVDVSMQEIGTRRFNCECDDTTSNETLAELRERVMVRLGYAAQVGNPPPGMELLLNEFLIGAQRTLYRRFDALRTERFFNWALSAGVRYYDLPDNLDICTKPLDTLKITEVYIEDVNGVWAPLAKGISPSLYTGSVFYGMPYRYEIRQCIEVFPAPDTRYILHVKGHFGLSTFAEDADKTTIDSELVFLWALGNAKAHYGQPDANGVKAEANTYRLDLIAGKHQTRRYVPGTLVLPSVPKPVFLPLQGGGS